jgi:sporulation protein YlmC with PRC-barrel domain
MFNKTFTKSLAGVGIAAALSLGAAGVQAQTSRSQTKLSVTDQETRDAERGWSAEKNFMGKTVYNDNDEKIGTIDDLVMSRNRSGTYAVIGVGGFLGIGKHDVAVPINRLKHDGDKLILSGATKDALKAMPEFKYAERENSSRTSSR